MVGGTAKGFFAFGLVLRRTDVSGRTRGWRDWLARRKRMRMRVVGCVPGRR